MAGDAVKIRRATVADAAPLAALKLRLFRETFLQEGFAIPYPPDDLAAFEHGSYAEPVVRAEIVDDARAIWIAERAGTAIGYAQVGACKLPHPDVRPAAGELQQLYLSREAQGSGLAARLLGLAMDHLAANRPGPVWLGVWSGNARAQRFYARHGFRKVGEYRFPVGSWLDDEFILRRD